MLSDEVTKYAVVEGAMLLEQALPYLPVGVHVGVVDPGVGTPRAPVALRTGRGDVLVGPDNGLLIPAAERLGGVAEARILENQALRFPQVSSTFHGRDIFSPAAAHLAEGVPLGDFGPLAEPRPLDLPQPVIGAGELAATVLCLDDFGSLILGAHPDDLAQALGEVTHVDVAGVRMPFTDAYGDVPPGDPLLFVDSSGRLAVAVNQGSAASRFGLAAGDVVRIVSR